MMHYTARSGLQEFIVSTTDDNNAFQGTGTSKTTTGIPKNWSLSLRHPNKTNISITIQAYLCIWFCVFIFFIFNINDVRLLIISLHNMQKSCISHS